MKGKGIQKSLKSYPDHCEGEEFELYRRLSDFVDRISSSIDSSSFEPKITKLKEDLVEIRKANFGLTPEDTFQLKSEAIYPYTIIKKTFAWIIKLTENHVLST